MNNCIFTGRLTKDPEIKTTQSGKKYVTFTIAVDRKVKDANGQRQADFIPCVAWNKTAETISQYFAKGSPIGVIGSLQVRSYDKDGEKKFIYEVLVNEFDFIGGSKSSDSKAQTETAAPAEVVDDGEPVGLPFEI